jgi:hypothetical protein
MQGDPMFYRILILVIVFSAQSLFADDLLSANNKLRSYRNVAEVLEVKVLDEDGETSTWIEKIEWRQYESLDDVLDDAVIMSDALVDKTKFLKWILKVHGAETYNQMNSYLIADRIQILKMHYDPEGANKNLSSAETDGGRVLYYFANRCPDRVCWRETASHPSTEDDVEKYLHYLRSPNDAVQSEAARRLGVLRDQRALEPLIACMENTDPKQYNPRFSCINAVANIGGENSKRALITCMKDIESYDYGLRTACIHAYDTVYGDEAFDFMVKVLKHDPHFEVRRFVARIFGLKKEPRAVPALVDILTEGECDQLGLVCVTAVWALGEIGDLSVVPTVIWQLNNNGYYIARQYAALALAELGTSECFEALRAALKTEADERVIKYIQIAIRRENEIH